MDIDVLYFSYGANMSTQKLAERGIRPKSSGEAAVVASQQYQRISFCHRGAFASLADTTQFLNQEQKKGGDLTYQPAHGVLYKIRKQDLRVLENIETGYSLVGLKVQLYDSSVCGAYAFVSKASLMLKGSLNPTKRYLELLVTGASEHSLKPEYICWLKQLQPHENGPLGSEYFDTPSALYANLAVLIGAAVCLYLFLH